MWLPSLPSVRSLQNFEGQHRKWQPIPVFLPEKGKGWQPILAFLPRKSHGQRSPAGYTPRDLEESDMTGHSTAQGADQAFCSSVNQALNSISTLFFLSAESLFLCGCLHSWSYSILCLTGTVSVYLGLGFPYYHHGWNTKVKKALWAFKIHHYNHKIFSLMVFFF